MPVDSTHPLYSEHLIDWEQMRDTYRGERTVKEAGFKYLPATSGMIEDGISTTQQPGSKAYNAYRVRARFPDSVRDAVEALLGVMHRKPATIELPEKMEDLRLKATARNESLQALLRRINEEQLKLGRTGLLADVAESIDMPYIAIYEAEDIINWDEGRSDGIEVQNLNLVTLNETENERIADFEWEEKQKHRIMLLTRNDSEDAALDAVQGEDGSLSGDSNIPVDNIPQDEGVYQMGVFRDTDTSFDPNALITPSIMGKALGKIPFVFVNTKDVVPEPDDPPLLGLSNLSLAIYRGEADYRQSLFNQGQDTLVVIGAAEKAVHRVGAGASIDLPQNGDAKFIGVDSQGLGEQRMSLENDYTRAGEKGGQLLDNVASGQASGESLRVRVSAKTATLNQIAITGAFALENILKIIAEWLGANPDEVVVIPNLDFADDQMSGKQLTEMMTGKMLGAPLSLESVHDRMQERGLTDKTFEEEIAQIEKEADLDLVGAGSSDDDGPEDNDEFGAGVDDEGSAHDEDGS